MSVFASTVRLMCHDEGMEPVDSDEQHQRLLRDPETGGIVLAHVLGNPQAMMAALEEFADREAAQIAFDTLVLADGTEAEVSTVDLVWTAPGGAFETMIFVGDDGPQFVQRYTSRDAATQGHQEIVLAVNAGMLDEQLLRRPTSS